MKKLILLLFVAVITATSQAQSNINFGIKAGLASASIRGDALNNLQDLLIFSNGMIKTQNRTGLFFGGYADIPLTDVISIEPGLYYTQKGYELKGDLGIKGIDFLGINAKAQLQLNYIDMPVLLKANLGNGIQIFAGPQFSYLSQANLKSSAGVLGINVFKNKLDATNQFNRWDMGVTAGVGYQFKGGFNISASYDYGLSKIDANKNVKGYNNAIKVGIGIRL